MDLARRLPAPHHSTNSAPNPLSLAVERRVFLALGYTGDTGGYVLWYTGMMRLSFRNQVHEEQVALGLALSALRLVRQIPHPERHVDYLRETLLNGGGSGGGYRWASPQTHTHKQEVGSRQ